MKSASIRHHITPTLIRTAGITLLTALALTYAGLARASETAPALQIITDEHLSPEDVRIDGHTTENAPSPEHSTGETIVVPVKEAEKEVIEWNPPSIAGKDMLYACREKMFTDRGTKYCMDKKMEQERHDLQRTDQVAYMALKHNEKPSMFRKKRRDLATDNLLYRYEMEQDCHNHSKSADSAFEKNITHMTCHIDHIKEYREQLGSRYIDRYDEKSGAEE